MAITAFPGAHNQAFAIVRVTPVVSESESKCYGLRKEGCKNSNPIFVIPPVQTDLDGASF
jgi:hypothetical protein